MNDIANKDLNYLYLASGSTPMTIAELVCRECQGDTDILQDVVYYIECYIKRTTESEEVNESTNI